jgi:hypothetical protein
MREWIEKRDWVNGTGLGNIQRSTQHLSELKLTDSVSLRLARRDSPSTSGQGAMMQGLHSVSVRIRRLE